MPGTTTKGIRYPTATDPFAPHLDIQKAAEDADVRMPTIPDQDAGFPVAINSASEAVCSRITVPAQTWAQVARATGTAWLSYTQTFDVDLLIYAGAAVVGRFRANMVGGVGRNLTVVSKAIAIPASSPMVLELRAVKSTGTGVVTGSVSSALTAFEAVVVAA